jgi:hypothetical protein
MQHKCTGIGGVKVWPQKVPASNVMMGESGNCFC